MGVGYGGGVLESMVASLLRTGFLNEVLGLVAEHEDSAIVPAFIRNAEDARKLTTASYQPVSLARLLSQYADRDSRVGVVSRSCDARAIIELVKRNQLDRDNIYLIGLECFGTASARQGIVNNLHILPDQIEENGNVRAWDETVVRRNCLRCEYPIPTMADVILSVGRNDSDVVFVTEKGKQLLNTAGLSSPRSWSTRRGDGRSPSSDGELDVVGKVEERVRERVLAYQQRDFGAFSASERGQRVAYWLSEFGRCIKCYGCRESCPLCSCKKCILDPDDIWVKGGEFPPDTMFHLIRLMHVAPQCINCGQCDDACPAGIPISKLYSLLYKQLGDVFHYESGIDPNVPPPLAAIGTEVPASRGGDHCD